MRATLVSRCVRPGLARRSACSSGHRVPSELRCLAIAVAAAPETEMAVLVSVQSAPATKTAAFFGVRAVRTSDRNGRLGVRSRSSKGRSLFFLAALNRAEAAAIGRSLRSLFRALAFRNNEPLCFCNGTFWRGLGNSTNAFMENRGQALSNGPPLSSVRYHHQRRRSLLVDQSR